MHQLDDLVVGIIGLGYVGLPLAAEFGKTRKTVGFDINPTRIEELRRGEDNTRELTAEDLAAAPHLELSCDLEDLRKCNVYIVSVPTPIDAHYTPDLTLIRKASETIGQVLSEGDIAIYESTVFPGATEEVCAPILEKLSGMKVNEGFYLGYSPERINPGDKENTLTKITKVTSGSTPEAAALIDALYGDIITAGTHLAPSIKVAEAAKVIENTQRDLNISLINELAKIFHLLDIDTLDVLKAAGTKWNFLPFRPGLVGGHCIGVDPYYLTYKAQEVGYHPEIILAGRRTNEGMADWIGTRIIEKMISKGLVVKGAKVLMLGFTFKENCPDIRNTRVLDLMQSFQRNGCAVDVVDPWVAPAEARHEYGLEISAEVPGSDYDAIVVAVGHREFHEMGPEKIRSYGSKDVILADIKGIFPKEEVDLRI
ncbi:MAG: nucleotide sugar dehydrogenase [Sulfitobacter sp.]